MLSLNPWPVSKRRALDVYYLYAMQRYGSIAPAALSRSTRLRKGYFLAYSLFTNLKHWMKLVCENTKTVSRYERMTCTFPDSIATLEIIIRPMRKINKFLWALIQLHIINYMLDLMNISLDAVFPKFQHLYKHATSILCIKTEKQVILTENAHYYNLV